MSNYSYTMVVAKVVFALSDSVRVIEYVFYP